METPFKVGDWIKEDFGGNTHARVIIVGDDYLVVKLCDGYSMSVTYQKRYCKVINPSDVIIHIGNGISGTVEPLNCECCKDKVFILRISKDEFIEIPLSVVKGPLQMIIDNLIEDIRNNTK